MSFTEAHKQWLDGGVPVQIPVETFNVTDVLGRMQETLAEILDVQRQLLARLGSSSDSRSSIEVKTSTRGVDIAAKTYADSPTDGLVDASVRGYFETMRQVQERLNGEKQS